jgi:cytochrome c556
MKRVALAPLLALAACTTTSGDVASLADTGPTPDQIVAARQASFNLSAVAFGGMRAASEGTAEAKAQSFAARGLSRWANALPGMFPSGTQLPNSRALSTVWSDRSGFDAQATLFQTATAQLLAAAQADDKTAFAAAYKATGAACASCHAAYRSEAPR